MKITRTIVRETDCLERGNPVMIEIGPRELTLRLKGQRRRYRMSYSGILWAAVRIEAEQAQRDKRLSSRLRRK
jgi:hypothetical protein